MEENNEELEQEQQELASETLPPDIPEEEVEFDTKDKQANVLLDAAAKLFFKKFKIPIFIIVGFFFIILLVTVVFNSSDVYEYEYIEPKCTNVRVTYDPYGPDEGSTTTLDLEEYVRRAVYAYAKDLDTRTKGDFFHVYASLAIAVRTEALANNCEVTYRDKRLNETIDENETIERALTKMKGIVITDLDGEYVDVQINDFNWQERKVNVEQSEDYILKVQNLPVSSDFVRGNLANSIYRNCPCNDPQGDPFDPENEYSECWITWDTDGDGIDDESEWRHQDEDGGYSVFASYYLAAIRGRTYDTIIEYYYGKDLMYKTTDEQNTEVDEDLKQPCTGDEIPVNRTPLSRTEFISLVEEFFANGNYASYAQYFVDYAGEIYDLGLEKGVNPEFIYIIARKETSFRHVNSNTDHYNYYGYAHTNESSHGAYFNSFMEGVETLMDWILEKGTFDAVVRSYSYLGDYLYNFDSEKESGTGGCYYLELIYGDNYSRCDDSYYCSPSNKTNCVLTTEEEKEAYIGWQHDQYILHREAIFKLGAQVCTGSEISTDPSLEVATSQLKEPLRDFLSSKGLSIEDLNTAILNNVLAAGVGTREGVAAAATTLINYMNALGVRIPYTFGGNHYSSITNVTNKPSTSFFGVDPEWGTSINNWYYPGGNKAYTHYGPDCSAFVAWVLHNGGVKISMNSALSFKQVGTNYFMDGKYIAQVGDVVSSGNHVRIIVDVNEAEQYYITAESQTSTGVYEPEFKGISYEKMSFINTKYVIVDMSTYFDNPANNYSANESEFVNRYNAGVLN